LGLRYLATVAIVAVVYFAAARFGLSLAFATKQVTAVWPPTGIALVAVLAFGPRIWPGVFLGAFWANAIADEPLTTAAGIAVGNTLAGLAGGWGLRKFVGFDVAIERTRDVLGLVLVACASTMLSASLGVANLALGGLVPWSAYSSVWWVWWVGDTLGILVFAPFVLTWSLAPRIQWRGWRLVEFITLFAIFCVVSAIVFTGPKAVAHAAYPFLIWAALRFGQRETVTIALLASGAAIWGAIHDRGPFGIGSLDERLVLLDTFVGATAVTALLLGSATAERRASQARVERAREELEQRVLARTAELGEANANLITLNADLTQRTTELANKNEEVEAFVYIVSHDLRGPLVNLQGFSQEVERSCKELAGHLQGVALPAEVALRVRPILDDAIPTALRFINASSTKFHRLIEALLALSRTGRQEFRSEPLNLDAVVGATLDSLRQLVVDSGATVTASALPVAVGDVTAIGQVFANLIGNALKYLQPGRPGAIAIGGEVDGKMARYWVRDNGSGIPASAQRRLFQVFQRFHPKLASGEGMGMAVVKRLVERHGGRVWVQSTEGEGTTVYLTLPAHFAA